MRVKRGVLDVPFVVRTLEKHVDDAEEILEIIRICTQGLCDEEDSGHRRGE